MPSIKLSPMRWFAILFVLLCVLSLALPPDPQALKTFHITPTGYRLVIVFLLIPEALLWYASFYAFAKLHEYASFIKGSKEHSALQRISLGMGVLAFGLIIPSIIALPLNYIAAHHEGFRATAAILNHYFSLLVALISFSLLRGGSQRLVGSGITIRRGSLLGMRLFAIFFIVLAVFYSYTTLHTRRFSGNPYYMGVFPLMVTIIIPYLYAWFEGMVSAYNLRLYSKHVKGLLYKQAFLQLSFGLVITIIGFIFVQFITSTLGARTDKSLGYILVLIYILLAILIAGLGLMAWGTRKLKRIEEV
jgi:hypothetical protein